MQLTGRSLFVGNEHETSVLIKSLSITVGQRGLTRNAVDGTFNP